jgi:hypothetical protein
MSNQLAILQPPDDAYDNCVGVVAQLVERLVRNEKVAGSNPVGSTSLTIISSLQTIKKA